MDTVQVTSVPQTIEEKERLPNAGAAGAGSAPLLDQGDTNVPSKWAALWNSLHRKQWRIRRAILDRLRCWQGNGYQCLWVTLTSSPESPPERLRKDWQIIRKRIMRELGFVGFEYVCVETREGHGVLHMVWAWKDPDDRKRASFSVPFEWLQESWKEVHGAFHVNLKRMGNTSTDARRLSRYIVAQYCGGQHALERMSQSRMAFPLTGMRKQLYRILRSLPERYEFGNALTKSLSGEEFSKAFESHFWSDFRVAWDSLSTVRSCEAYGVQFVLEGRQVVRV